MPLDQTITSTSTSVDTTTYTAFDVTHQGNEALSGGQAALCTISLNALPTTTTDTVTFTAVLTDKTTVFRAVNIVGTPTTVRAAPAGASGNYLCTVSCSETSNSKMDLLGLGAGTAEWRVGCTVLPTGVTTAILGLVFTGVV